MRARYYDPTTGQFLTIDPLVVRTGQRYAYAADDPINNVDVSGLVSSQAIRTLRTINTGSNAIGAAAGVCDLTGVGIAAGCGEVSLVAGAVSGGTSLALYYYCHNPVDLINGIASTALGGLGKLAEEGAAGARELITEAQHLNVQSIEEASQELVTKRVVTAIGVGHELSTEAGDFGDNFAAGIKKLGGLL
jgi:hypothetical protein